MAFVRSDASLITETRGPKICWSLGSRSRARRAGFPPRVLVVPEPVEEELVPYLSGLLVEALVQIDRDLAPYLAAAHVLRDAAALKRPVLEEAAGHGGHARRP